MHNPGTGFAVSIKVVCVSLEVRGLVRVMTRINISPRAFEYDLFSGTGDLNFP